MMSKISKMSAALSGHYDYYSVVDVTGLENEMKAYIKKMVREPNALLEKSEQVLSVVNRSNRVLDLKLPSDCPNLNQ